MNYVFCKLHAQNDNCSLNCRGFYPKGRGEVIVSPTPLKELTPVTITDPGHLTSIKIHAFVAGAVRPQVRIHVVSTITVILMVHLQKFYYLKIFSYNYDGVILLGISSDGAVG